MDRHSMHAVQLSKEKVKQRTHLQDMPKAFQLALHSHRHLSDFLSCAYVAHPPRPSPQRPSHLLLQSA